MAKISVFNSLNFSNSVLKACNLGGQNICKIKLIK
jgi:hypothetical protein